MSADWLLYIGGEFVPAADGGAFDSLDPSTEEVVATVARATAADVDRAVERARQALEGAWGATLPKRRGEFLHELSRALEADADAFAQLETADTGKPLSRSRREVASSVRYLRYYAGAADKIQGDTIPLGPEYVDFTLREPLGVTAHIVPWNAPLNMVARSLAPALAAGNTAVVKPAMETPLTALRLARLCDDVGLPPGVYNVIPGPGTEVGDALARHPGVDGITFTGSVETGRSVMRAAAEHVTPVVLELGGKSPNVVFDDADLDLAVAETVKGIYANSGQFCNASSRVLVDQRVHAEVVRRLAGESVALRVGRGADDPDLGPLISATQRDRVLGYIGMGRDEGARVVVGGGPPEGFERGFYVSPTVLDRVPPSARVAQEEIFGPVVAVSSFADEQEALVLANAVPYGLAAGIFTRDLDRALRLATGIKAGQIYVNEYFAGGEETPFGGYKRSGFGREKGLVALDHYTQVKNVAIRLRR